MRPFSSFYGFALVVYGIYLVWRIRKGKLQGGLRVALILLGFFALGIWVAITLGGDHG